MKKLLIVDDDIGWRECVKDLLEPYGYIVFGAWDSQTALDKASVVDVAFVDADLAGVVDAPTGLDVIKELRTIYPQLKIVLVTGHSQNGRCWAKELEVEYLPKESFARLVLNILKTLC